MTRTFQKTVYGTHKYNSTTCLAMVRKLKMTNAVNPQKGRPAIGFEEQAFRLLTQTRVEKAALIAALKRAEVRA